MKRKISIIMLTFVYPSFQLVQSVRHFDVPWSRVSQQRNTWNAEGLIQPVLSSCKNPSSGPDDYMVKA